MGGRFNSPGTAVVFVEALSDAPPARLARHRRPDFPSAEIGPPEPVRIAPRLVESASLTPLTPEHDPPPPQLWPDNGLVTLGGDHRGL